MIVLVAHGQALLLLGLILAFNEIEEILLARDFRLAEILLRISIPERLVLTPRTSRADVGGKERAIRRAVLDLTRGRARPF